jgi:hypothetical protein
MNYFKFFEDTKYLGFSRTTFDVDIKNGIITRGGFYYEDTENIGIEKLVLNRYKEEIKSKEFIQYESYRRSLKNKYGKDFNVITKFVYALEQCNLIFIENNRINYRQWRLTNGQYRLLSIYCKIESHSHLDNVLLPKDWTPSKEEIDKEIKDLEEEREYYLDYKNQFHIPSGCIRIEYQNWLNRCRKVGLYTD